MDRLPTSSKKLQIVKAGSTITVTLVVASLVTVFCVVASKSLLTQRAYQAKVIDKKETALKTLNENIDSANTLFNSYKEFTARPENVIGGSSAGTGERDGDNAKIILDALPSKYDFPALASSLEKVITQKNLKIVSITGTDDELAQSGSNAQTPTVVEMPFTYSVSGSYDGVYDLIKALESSIRPMSVTKLTITTSTGDTQITVSAKTYYQSEKKLNITTKEVQ